MAEVAAAPVAAIVLAVGVQPGGDAHALGKAEANLLVDLSEVARPLRLLGVGEVDRAGRQHGHQHAGMGAEGLGRQIRHIAGLGMVFADDRP